MSKIDTNPQKIEALLTRGVENIFPSKEFVAKKLASGERLTVYLGVDPTGPSLHMGHVIPLLRLAKFQELGHQIILLVGDFTAMIGDPTDKSSTRKKLSREEVLQNLKEYQNQASKIISFSGENKALIKFNSEWLGKMNFAEVLELASHITADQLAKRAMFVERAKEGKPTYAHEFLYPLMQGYDSVAMDVDGEIGGNDQTFNMLVGRDLMKSLKNKEKFVIATRLLADASGKKMGKTEGNMVSLDQSPEETFGAVMSWRDGMIVPAFELLTDVPMQEINTENPKEAKMKLAKEIVQMYHGEKAAEQARQNFEKTFGEGKIPENISEVSASQGETLANVLLEQKIVESKTEWRRLVDDGAVTRMEKDEKISDPNARAETGTYKIGKRRFIKISVLP